MSGLMHSSLWLIPNEGTPFWEAYQELIDSIVPGNFVSFKDQGFKSHHFIPHVTLTSDVDPSKTYEKSSSPQEWLDSLELPEFKKEKNEVVVELDQVASGESFFRKLVIELTKNANLDKLAAQCRKVAVGVSEEEAQKWAKDDFAPHMSLMYSDLKTREVERRVGTVELNIGWSFGSLFACCGSQVAGSGQIVLVDTSKEVSEWSIIATRKVNWVSWMLSRNLV